MRTIVRSKGIPGVCRDRANSTIAPMHLSRLYGFDGCEITSSLIWGNTTNLSVLGNPGRG